MLALLEPMLRRLSAAQSDTDVRYVLEDACTGFGFRSAYLIEYQGELSSTKRVIDTDTSRLSWWGSYFASDLRPTPTDVARMLEKGSIQHLDGSRFASTGDKLRVAMETWDLVDVTAIPVSQDGELVGTVGFVGRARPDHGRDLSLILLAYAAFALPGTANSPIRTPGLPSLTGREREVMKLAAQGFTSEEIAARLGIAARTINQHVDNVATKLGTRNRAHAVAEIMRLGLL